MEVEFREQLMPTCLARRGTPHDFEVLRSPIFEATVVCTDLHSLVPYPTMPFEKCRHYGVAFFLARAPIQFLRRHKFISASSGVWSTKNTKVSTSLPS